MGSPLPALMASCGSHSKSQRRRARLRRTAVLKSKQMTQELNELWFADLHQPFSGAANMFFPVADEYFPHDFTAFAPPRLHCPNAYTATCVPEEADHKFDGPTLQKPAHSIIAELNGGIMPMRRSLSEPCVADALPSRPATTTAVPVVHSAGSDWSLWSLWDALVEANGDDDASNKVNHMDPDANMPSYHHGSHACAYDIGRLLSYRASVPAYSAPCELKGLRTAHAAFEHSDGTSAQQLEKLCFQNLSPGGSHAILTEPFWSRPSVATWLRAAPSVPSPSPFAVDTAEATCDQRHAPVEAGVCVEELIAEQFKLIRGNMHSGCRTMAVQALDQGYSLDNIEEHFVELCRPIVLQQAVQLHSRVVARWPSWQLADIEDRMLSQLTQTVRFWISDTAGLDTCESAGVPRPCKLKGINKRGMVQSKKKRR